MTEAKQIRGWANVYKEKGSVMEYSIFLYADFERAEKQNELGRELKNAPKRMTEKAIFVELEVPKE